jgi:hypothetical protein
VIEEKADVNSAFNITENHNESEKDSNDIQMDRKKTITFFLYAGRSLTWPHSSPMKIMIGEYIRTTLHVR